MTEIKRPVNIHQGKNAKRLREAINIKQEVIAQELNITQQAISNLEKKAELDDETIIVYARILNIDEIFIRNLIDDSQPDNTNNFFDQSSQILQFNPLDKVIELCSEKDQLYERMLTEKERATAILEKVIEKYLNKD